jgi:hypothetical protein
MNSVEHKEQILTYPIASMGMGYTVENERTVCLQGDSQTGFSLYGQIPDGGEASTVNLAEVLLEFAITWNMPGDPREARRQMQIFGGRIGQALATQSAQIEPLNDGLGRAAYALEDVLCSLDAAFACCQTQSEVCYQLDQSPLRVAGEVTGLEQEAELAHHAFSAICQGVVGAINPELELQFPGGPNTEHTITLTAPNGNGR